MKVIMDYLSEDFLGLGNNKPIKSCFRHAFKRKDGEQFGFFYFDDNGYDYGFKALNNNDLINSNHFCVENKLFYDYYLSDKVISIFHTHVISSPNLSEIDLAISDSLGVPSYVLSVKSNKSSLYYPESYNPPDLYKRIFIPFFQDCITFVKDFYFLNLNINLSLKIKNWARNSSESNYSLINEIERHFAQVEPSSLEYGDLLVFKPSLTNLFHVGVVDSGNKYSHHPMGALPSRELFTKETLNNVYKIYRYKEL